MGLSRSWQIAKLISRFPFLTQLGLKWSDRIPVEFLKVRPLISEKLLKNYFPVEFHFQTTTEFWRVFSEIPFCSIRRYSWSEFLKTHSNLRKIREVHHLFSRKTKLSINQHYYLEVQANPPKIAKKADAIFSIYGENGIIPRHFLLNLT